MSAEQGQFLYQNMHYAMLLHLQLHTIEAIIATP